MKITERLRDPNGVPRWERDTEMTAKEAVEIYRGGVRSLFQTPVPNLGSHGGNSSGSSALPSTPKLRAIGYTK